jgi:hypothetical protein
VRGPRQRVLDLVSAVGGPAKKVVTSGLRACPAIRPLGPRPGG